jgi:hypothetical protein
MSVRQARPAWLGAGRLETRTRDSRTPILPNIRASTRSMYTRPAILGILVLERRHNFRYRAAIGYETWVAPQN